MAKLLECRELPLADQSCSRATAATMTCNDYLVRINAQLIGILSGP